MEIFGISSVLGLQIMAGIGDVRRFHAKKAPVTYADIAAPPNNSGDMTGRHKGMSKAGASSLRRTLFLVMNVCWQKPPLDEPVPQLMDRKRAEGKPYRAYTMTSANKSVTAFLNSLAQI